MSVKFGVSFNVTDEKERSLLKEKFERHLERSNKEHFIKIVDYFNFRRNEVEEKIRLEKSVVPKFMLRLINSECSTEIEVINERFPKTARNGSHEYTLVSSWMFKAVEFIKKYKVSSELVYLNVNTDTNDVYLTIENIKGRDEEMSNKAKKYAISLNYETVEARDIVRDRMLEFAKENEKNSDVFERLLACYENHGFDVLDSPKLTSAVKDMTEMLMIEEDPSTLVRLVNILTNPCSTGFIMKTSNKVDIALEDLLDSLELRDGDISKILSKVITMAKKDVLDRNESIDTLVSDLLKRTDITVKLNLCGDIDEFDYKKVPAKEISMFETGLPTTKDSIERILRFTIPNNRGLEFTADAHDKIHNDIRRSLVNNHNGVLLNKMTGEKTINITLVIGARGYKGIFGRLFGKKVNTIDKNDVRTIVTLV